MSVAGIVNIRVDHMHKKNLFAFPLLLVVGISAALAAPTTPDSGKAATGKAATPAVPVVSPEYPIYKFGAYGSLGLSHSSMDQGDYVLETNMSKGVGRSSSWSARNNSRIAAHVTARFAPQVTGILQVDSEYHSDGTYRPRVEWVNLKYAFTPDYFMRVGRLPIPTFIDSENHDVGYSYTWVNPPIDLYQLSLFSADGVDATYRSEIGDAVNIVRAIYGNRTDAKDVWGIFDKIEYGSATFYAGYQQRSFRILDQLTGVPEAWVQSSDLSFGASYDPGDWFVMSEWIQRRTTTKLSAMYVSGGYRIEKFTPYLTYSQIGQASFLSGFPAPTATAVELANRSQSTVSVGTRWDFTRNADLKVQYDRVKLGDYSNGYLVEVPAGVTLNGSSFDVISVVVDFVF